MKPDVTYSRNYISVEKGRFRAYYGIDETDPITQEWQMVIWRDGVEKARYDNSSLLAESSGERPVDLFLVGLCRYFMK